MYSRFYKQQHVGLYKEKSEFVSQLQLQQKAKITYIPLNLRQGYILYFCKATLKSHQVRKIK